MPYANPAQQALPYASGSETSHDAARAAAGSAQTQRAIMARHYERHAFSGVTDHEMHALTGFPINVINARRHELPVVKIGRRVGPFGVMVSAWALEGRR